MTSTALARVGKSIIHGDTRMTPGHSTFRSSLIQRHGKLFRASSIDWAPYTFG